MAMYDLRAVAVGDDAMECFSVRLNNKLPLCYPDQAMLSLLLLLLRKVKLRSYASCFFVFYAKALSHNICAATEKAENRGSLRGCVGCEISKHWRTISEHVI
jgi:hypothetical protein